MRVTASLSLRWRRLWQAALGAGLFALVATPALALTASLSPLDFGKLVPTAASGTVTISPGGIRTASHVVLFNQSSTHTAATLTVSNGPPNGTCTLVLPALPVLLTRSSAPSLVLTTLTTSLGTSETFPLNGAGSASLTVGGTATVGASQAAGGYSGGLSVGADCTPPPP